MDKLLHSKFKKIEILKFSFICKKVINWEKKKLKMIELDIIY